MTDDDDDDDVDDDVAAGPFSSPGAVQTGPREYNYFALRVPKPAAPTLHGGTGAPAALPESAKTSQEGLQATLEAAKTAPYCVQTAPDSSRPRQEAPNWLRRGIQEATRKPKSIQNPRKTICF